MSETGNYVKSIVRTKFQKTHVCLHSEMKNRVPITESMTASGWLFGIFINFDIFIKLN